MVEEKKQQKKLPLCPIFCPKCKSIISKEDEIIIVDKGYCLNCEIEKEYNKQVEELNNGKL